MSDLALREVRLGDHRQIEDLKSRYGLPAYTEAEWRHLYEQSPLLRRQTLDWPWGWVLEDADGVLHGHLGNVPVEYAFDGRSVAAAAASDWVVEEGSRGRSLQLVLQFFRANPAGLLLNTTASADYGRAYGALGAYQPSLDGYDRRLTWPVNRTRTAAVALRQMGRPSAGALPRAAAGALWPVTASGRAARAAGLGLGVERTERFDVRFDAFWEGLRGSGGLVCARDAEALHWRYGRGLASGDVWVHTLSDGGSLSALLIVAKIAGPSALRAQLIDLQDRSPSHRRTAALVASVLGRCRQEGVDAFQAAGLPRQTQRRLTRCGGIPQHIPPLGFYFKASEPDLQSSLELPGAWCPSPFDGDGMCGTPQFFGLRD